MIPALTTLAAALLCFLCVRHHAREIPADLLSRSRQALAEAGIPADGLAFDGRFAILRGVEGTPAVSVKAKQIVESVWGVHHARIEAIPAPPEPGGGGVQQRLTEITRQKGVEFEKGNTQITEEGQRTLDEVAAVLGRSPKIMVEIGGHTDSRGRASRNRQLSLERAEAVKAYLAAKGIQASRMAAAGYGSARPLASNKTEEGRRANRRIEFTVKEGQ
jgi:outer membrane protein OmpA-like peptidoglycan-associated protein